MSTNLELQLYSSIEINLKMARHAFSCLGFLEWLYKFGWNISTYRARTAGLGSNQRYFEVDYEFIKWPSSQSMYNQKLGHQRPSKAKNIIFALETLEKMHEFDKNRMENSKKISETKFSWKYLQFDTISSHLAQFDNKQ